MKITCIAKNNDPNDFRELDLMEDVYYIELHKRIPLFHTKFGPYFQVVTLDALTHWLKPYGFEQLDRTNLVKMDKIIFIDSNERTIYFDNEIKASISSVYIEKMIMDNKYKHLFEKRSNA